MRDLNLTQIVTRAALAEKRRQIAEARRTQSALDHLQLRDRRHQRAVLTGGGVRKPGEPRNARWD